MKNDETATETQYVGAAPHYLESWGDLETKSGFYALMQPTIRPLFDTQQFQEALLVFNGSALNYHDYIKSFWTETILKEGVWNQALHDGVYTGTALATLDTATSKIFKTTFSPAAAISTLSSVKSSDFELTFDCFSISLLDGVTLL